MDTLKKKATVLLVDDVVTQLTEIGRHLMYDFNLISMNNIADMFKYLDGTAEKPSIILLDIVMTAETNPMNPYNSLDGLLALEQLKKNPDWSSIPVMMITGFGREYSDDSYRKILEMGAIDVYFKHKPHNGGATQSVIIDPSLLINRLHNYIKWTSQV